MCSDFLIDPRNGTGAGIPVERRPSSLESPDAFYHGSGVKRRQGKEKVEVKPLRHLIRESHTREIPHSCAQAVSHKRAHMQMHTNAHVAQHQKEHRI